MASRQICQLSEFVYGCSLGILLLKQTDNLSRALQDSKMSAAVGSAFTHDVIQTLSKDRNDDAYEQFWECVLKRKEKKSSMFKIQNYLAKRSCHESLMTAVQKPTTSHQLQKIIIARSIFKHLTQQPVVSRRDLTRFPKMRPSAGNVPESKEGSAVRE